MWAVYAVVRCGVREVKYEHIENQPDRENAVQSTRNHFTRGWNTNKLRVYFAAPLPWAEVR